MNRVIVIDATNIQHVSIFSYLGQYKREMQKIMTEQNLDQDSAKRILDKQIKDWAVFISSPTLTFCRMIIGYFKKLEVTLNDQIVFAIDFGSWRKKEDKNYKANRKEFKETFATDEWWKWQYKQFNRLYEQLDESLPIHLIKIYEKEADDIMSVSARFFKDKEVIIISSDKDVEMLTYFPNVKIYSPLQNKGSNKKPKFKDIKDPLKILNDKIQKEVSDNLLDTPSTEAEWEKRKKIVDLTQLPLEIEQPIREALSKLYPKNVYLEKVPFKSVQREVKKLYNL